MKQKQLLLIPLTSVAVGLISGCSVYKVRNVRGKSARGIPANVVTARLRQQTTWIEPRYELTIVETSADGKTKTERWKGEFAQGGWDRIQIPRPGGAPPRPSLYRDLLDTAATATTWGQVSAQAKALEVEVVPATGAKMKDRGLLLEENKVEVITSIDPAERVFVNVDRPIIGSSSAKIELAADGTLKSAEASVEDKFVETFLGLLPIKEKLSERWLDPAAAAALRVAPSRLEVTLKRRAIRHRLRQVLASTATLQQVPKPIKLPSRSALRKTTDIEYQRIEGAGGGGAGTKPKYTFSGSVAEPKS